MTHAPISEGCVPFALLALERFMFIRAVEKACCDLSVGRSRRSLFDSSLLRLFIFALARRPRQPARVPLCRTRTRSLRRTAVTDGPRGEPFAGLSSQRDLS